MFWDKAYTPSPNIEALLEKQDLKVEELLDDEDILQECKNQKRNLVQYLTRPDVIKRLIELTISEPPENLPTAQRFKYANIACEVLTFGLPSLDEKLVEDPEILQALYSFLEQEPPLNPLLSSFFSKTFSMLISKKSEQDWFLYQKMCLQVLEFIKTRCNFLDLIFKHFATPVIMDLLLQMIKEVQGGALKKNLYEWLTEQQLFERLINMLGQPEESEKHNNIAEFISDVIKNSRSMRQKEQDNDSFEPAFVGSDPLLQVIEDEKTISLLLDVILGGEANETSIVAGIKIVLTLVDESIVDEPASDKALQMIIDKEKENHEKIVSTVIRAIALKLKDFHNLLLNPPKKNCLVTTVTQPSSFGLTRLQICRLFTVLLKTGNKDITKEICETEFFDTLLKLFKQYSWNNFLHSEVEKCFQYVFATFDQNDNEKGFNLNPSALQIFVIVNCKIVPKLIDSWMHNRDVQSSTNGHRLGYMGHLIQIFKHITTCISNSDRIGALIESNLNEDELENWKLITDKQNGELTKDLELQNKMLANCNAHETSDFSVSLQKEFHNENFCSEIYNEIESNLFDCLNDQNSSDKLFNVMNCFLTSPEDMVLNLERDFKVWDGSLYNNDTQQPLNITLNPWGSDTFTNSSSNNEPVGEWGDFANNFADFESHFNSFSSDLGDYNTTENQNPSQNPSTQALNELKSNTTNNNNDVGNNEKNEFDKNDNDDGNNKDEFEIHFRNAKNLNMKTEEENDSDDDNGSNNIDEDEIDNKNGENDNEFKVGVYDAEKTENIAEISINQERIIRSNDHTSDKICQNSKEDGTFQEANFSDLKNDAQMINTKFGVDFIKDNEKNGEEEEHIQKEQEQQTDHTSHGPVENSIHNSINRKNERENLNKNQSTEEIFISSNEKVINKENELLDVKSTEIIFEDNSSVEILGDNDDLLNNSPTETESTNDNVNGSGSDDIPLDTQENGPV